MFSLQQQKEKDISLSKVTASRKCYQNAQIQ